MVPAANLIGFGGEQIVRKIYNVVGLIIETTLGSIVEIVVFAILITRSATSTFDPIQIIQAAILGSVLANLLFCVGLCFFIGGMKREEQRLHAAIGEVGSGLILVAGSKSCSPSVRRLLLTVGSGSDSALCLYQPSSKHRVWRDRRL